MAANIEPGGLGGRAASFSSTPEGRDGGGVQVSGERESASLTGLFLIVGCLPLLAAPPGLQAFLAITLIAAAVAWWLCGLLPR